MDFSFTEEQKMIADTARDFFSENATSERTRAAMDGEGIDRALWKAFCEELGLGGVLVSEADGGAGLGHVEFASIAEAAGAQVASLPMLGQAMACSALGAGGSEAQKSEYLPPIAGGELIVATAAAADLSVNGPGLSGEFTCVAGGAIADVFILAGPEGAWLVRADAEAVCVQGHTTMDQTRQLATVTLANAQGDALPQWEAALKAANRTGFLCLAAEALGGAQACLDQTVAFAQDRVQFGRQIGSFQAYKHRLADMMVEIEQARSAVYWAACAIDENTDDPDLAVHAAKSFCADTFFRCAGDMIQLHGGIGFTWEHDAHLYFKRARSIQTMLMNGDWHREQIATMILGEAA
ncbi:MAG: acyl-CoA dehydrogenase family protein [Pontixanthobacter sp.]